MKLLHELNEDITSGQTGLSTDPKINYDYAKMRIDILIRDLGFALQNARGINDDLQMKRLHLMENKIKDLKNQIRDLSKVLKSV